VTNSIVTTLSRKPQVGQSSPARYSAIRQAAESLSLRNADQSVIELYMETLMRLASLCYEMDDNGYCNIDTVTSKLLIPAPWGRKGFSRWLLTPSESIVLREMVQQRQVGRRGMGEGVWLYDAARRCWRLNSTVYKSVADAQQYLERWPLSITEYRLARSRRRRR
jgi:hypothetical protein